MDLCARSSPLLCSVDTFPSDFHTNTVSDHGLIPISHAAPLRLYLIEVQTSEVLGERGDPPFPGFTYP